jgi:hypothetical protein
MLSYLLRMHPEVLGIDEFWNCFKDTEGSIPVHDMAGQEYWRRLTTPASSYDHLVRLGIKQDDGIASFPTRFDYVTGMPPFWRVLAPLFEAGKSPDQLFDELAAVVSGWPSRPVADHCRALFGELAARLGRPVIFERSGGSLDNVELLREMFPGALFVFLHRDGPDAALSMSRYPTFRLWAIKELAGMVSGASPDQLEEFPPEIRATSPEELRALVEPPFDKESFLKFPVPFAVYGWLWSNMTRTGTREIRKVPRDRWTILRYELLLRDPRAELARLAAFIGASADEQWLDRACPLVDPGRTGSAAAKLHPGDLAALRASCASGTRAFDLLESEHKAAAA